MIATRIIASLSLGVAFGLAAIYPLAATVIAMLAIGLYWIGSES